MNAVLDGSRVGRVKGENTVVPMYSEFFSRANGNMMVTANSLLLPRLIWGVKSARFAVSHKSKKSGLHSSIGNNAHSELILYITCDIIKTK